MQRLLNKYLKHLGVGKRSPSHGALKDLVKAQIIKFPFENISKLVRLKEKNLKDLVDFETHLLDSIELGCGGTCYPNNFYFSKLLSFLGYDVSLHGADMGEEIDVHLVLFVKIENKNYFIDVGYGAPFYKPLPLDFENSITISWGELSYTFTKEKDGRPRITVFKRGKRVHGYVVNFAKRDINYFTNTIKRTFRDEAEFMRILRIVRYFEDYSIDLKNLKCTINKKESAKSFQLKTIDEVEDKVGRDFKLPNFPIKKAYEVLKDKGLDLATSNKLFEY